MGQKVHAKNERSSEEHSLVAVKIIPMVEIIPELKFILAAQNQPQE